MVGLSKSKVAMSKLRYGEMAEVILVDGQKYKSPTVDAVLSLLYPTPYH